MARRRATAVIVKDGAILITRNRWDRKFSLPGGGVDSDESSQAAVAREVREELGFTVVSVRPLTHFTRHQDHDVYLVTVKEENPPRLQEEEIADALWWTGEAGTPVFDSVRQARRALRANSRSRSRHLRRHHRKSITSGASEMR